MRLGGDAFELRWGDILVESKLEDQAKKRRAAGAHEATFSAGSTHLIALVALTAYLFTGTGNRKRLRGETQKSAELSEKN